jgi:hypothetical protein
MMTTRVLSLEQVVGGEVFKSAGLAKLTPKEQDALRRWIEQRVASAIRNTEESIKRHGGPNGPPPFKTPKP